MRKLKFALMAIIILVAIIFSFKHFHLKNFTQANNELTERNENEEGERTDDLAKALKEEEELMKDPRTGKIPEGIRELELMQARDIFRTQVTSRENRVASTSYTYQGPNNLGGRTRAITFDISDATSNTILAGCVSGGVFKTTNGGTSWTRVSPSDQNFTVTTIVQDPRAGSRQTWYYAGGESLGNSAGETGAFYAGNGIYKSVDNGGSWTRLANSNTGSLYSFDNTADLITRLAVNPTNGDVYAACLGKIMRSQDGGTTWSDVLTSGAGSSTNITDIIVTSTGRFYAAFSGNTASADGVWTSTTGNSGSWTRIAGTGAATNPAGWNALNAYGRIVLGLTPSNENIVYAMYWNNLTSNCSGTVGAEAEFYKWDQSTTTWTDLSATLPNEAGCLNGNDPFAVQTGYDMVVSVKPDDANTIVIGGTNVYRSTDGGATWTRIGGYASSVSYALYTNHHPDIHALVFKPSDSKMLVSGDDGGIQISDITAGTVSWTPLNNSYQTYQYYHVAIKQELGVNDFVGGAQDNGTTAGIGGSSSFASILSGDGVAVGLGAGASPYKQYCGSQNGFIVRRNSGLANGFYEADLTPSGVASIFVTYFLLDPDNTENLYYAGQVAGVNKLLRITNASTATNTSWQTFSFSFSGFIRAMATTRGTYSATNRLYLGTTSGRVYRITDPVNADITTTTPTDITPTGMAGGGTVISIAVNPTNHDEILVVYSNYLVNSAWYTNNAGSATPTWSNVEGNLSLPSYRSAMILQNGATTEYYVGTSVGLYKTTTMNGGATVWSQEAASEIGNSLVTSLSLRPVDNTFAIGTHGSGMWKAVVGGTLPVRFTDFTGTLVNNSSYLKWTTAQENRNKGFEVERSYDGVTFKKIGFVNGVGNSTASHTYNFADKEIAQNENYYRLRQVDIDGNAMYSSVVLIRNRSAVSSTIKILQNPFTGYLDMQLPKRNAKQLTARLIDMSGKVVYNQTVNSNQTKIRLSFEGRNFSRGTYLLQVTDGAQQYTTKVLKQ